MERNKALVVATAAAVAVVTASLGFAATRLATPAPDNVGKLAAQTAAPSAAPQIQYVYEDVLVPVEGQAFEPRVETSGLDESVAATQTTDPFVPSPSPLVAAPTTTVAPLRDDPADEAFEVEDRHDDEAEHEVEPREDEERHDEHDEPDDD